MITVAILLLSFGVVLLVLLLLIAKRGEVEVSGYGETGDRAERRPGAAFPSPELVLRIFSAKDRKFVVALGSRRLERMFEAERRKVALHWVRQVSRETKEIMRVHRLASRWHHDLNAAAEAELTLDYLRLRLVCALLGLLISAFGPHSLDQLAGYAGTLYGRIDSAIAHTRIVTRLPESETAPTR